ncbi:MAG TPA: SpoIIE family protein phosphatase [Acidobacteriota bacterium]|nr:SpoIIE family protein phosphatase [Acidobacteriota bacterium]
MAILPRGISSTASRVWAVLLLGAPLALAGGIWLQYRIAEAQDFTFTVDYGESIRLAQTLAAGKGLDTSEWTTFSAATGDQDLHHYYRLDDAPWRTELRRIAPEARIRVLQHRPEEDGAVGIFESYWSPRGNPLGFLVRDANSASPSDSSPQADLQAARQALQERQLGALVGDWGEPETSTVRRGARSHRRYVWKASPQPAPEFILEVDIEVWEGEVVGDVVEGSLKEEFVEANLQAYRWHSAVSWGLFWIMVVIMAFYAAVRYARRAQQKELSHARALTIAAILAVCYVAIVLLNIFDTIGMAVVEAPWWLMWIIVPGTVLSYGLFGLLVGGAWAAGEGDVRERHAGKLTSWDALVTGRFFSRNVALAYLWGFACGAWLLLGATLLQSAFWGAPQLGESIEHMVTLFFSRMPWLFTFVSPWVSTLPLMVTTLLLPISISSKFRSERLRRIAFGLMAVTGSLLMGLLVHPVPAGWLTTLLLAAVLVFLWHTTDLLTAAVAAATYSFLRSLIIVGSGTDFTSGITTVSAVLIALTLLIEGYFAFRGRVLSQDEVRPLYARHAEQRQAMQAEKEAAREAQLALAPRQTPSLPGVGVAAACQPARTVGGDFYDFFLRAGNRLGILLAEGGGRGLSSALSIAYAKGLLLPLRDESLSASEVLRRVLPGLHPYLEGGEMGILYAVVDSSAGRFDFARYGDYPRLLRCRSASSLEVPETASRLRLPGEHSPLTIRHGTFDLRPGEKICCFTDGIAEVLEASQSGMAEEWIRSFLVSRGDDSAEEIQEALLGALKVKARKAKMNGVEDDLSSVILHFERREQGSVQPYAEEEVA